MGGLELALGMEFRPPRMISAMTEEVNSTSATNARNKICTSTLVSPSIRRARKPGTGQIIRQTKIHKSSGVLRNSSM